MANRESNVKLLAKYQAELKEFKRIVDELPESDDIHEIKPFISKLELQLERSETDNTELRSILLEATNHLFKKLESPYEYDDDETKLYQTNYELAQLRSMAKGILSTEGQLVKKDTGSELATIKRAISACKKLTEISEKEESILRTLFSQLIEATSDRTLNFYMEQIVAKAISEVKKPTSKAASDSDSKDAKSNTESLFQTVYEELIRITEIQFAQEERMKPRLIQSMVTECGHQLAQNALAANLNPKALSEKQEKFIINVCDQLLEMMPDKVFKAHMQAISKQMTNLAILSEIELEDEKENIQTAVDLLKRDIEQLELTRRNQSINDVIDACLQHYKATRTMGTSEMPSVQKEFVERVVSRLGSLLLNRHDLLNIHKNTIVNEIFDKMKHYNDSLNRDNPFRKGGPVDPTVRAILEKISPDAKHNKHLDRLFGSPTKASAPSAPLNSASAAASDTHRPKSPTPRSGSESD